MSLLAPKDKPALISADVMYLRHALTLTNNGGGVSWYRYSKASNKRLLKRGLIVQKQGDFRSLDTLMIITKEGRDWLTKLDSHQKKTSGEIKLNPIQELIARHATLLETNPYAYFELAYTRRTEWMAWLCSKPREDDPDRVVLASGQGSTPEEACADALASFGARS